MTAIVALLWLAVAPDAALPAVAPPPRPALVVTVPPKGYPAKYTKYVNANGFPVLGSARVNDFALLEAGYLINQMLATRPDVRAALIASTCRFVVMAPDEFTTDVPEHADLTPKEYWNRRARGLGATPSRPAVSCGEENLLNLRGDPYATENILVHEFAHAIHIMGLNRVDRTFDKKLKTIYDRAIADGLWEGKYASRNRQEYWAEAVQSYFDTNRPPDHDHNEVRTRDGLKKYDPRIFELVDETFRATDWRYKKPADRAQPGHMAGYNSKDAKRFKWPADLANKLPKN
ncbi:hypothetical protein [Fimbriiglobus ruber]|uniref:Uncharacterized protein n=1 Tax=Fimbriiglobus ruber TaxID=1908690 RepID=A0A225DPK5_9BACT|nr:hypothetical protein [Fimbriiglobus ruber]OWK43013.1 hypothetical protein FRUB_02612 [Fimbriiglobus ruber]